jgi:insulysin
VNAEFLQPALDRFAEFFIAPLFTSSATDRELNAIESEHSKNINNDGFNKSDKNDIITNYIYLYLI